MLQISLRDPSAVFGQGDEVAGEVVWLLDECSGFKDISSGAPVRIVIELIGSAKAKGKGRLIYHGE
jgi:hypothetical protein